MILIHFHIFRVDTTSQKNFGYLMSKSRAAAQATLVDRAEDQVRIQLWVPEQFAEFCGGRFSAVLKLILSDGPLAYLDFDSPGMSTKTSH